jgi:hypothetical protein
MKVKLIISIILVSICFGAGGWGNSNLSLYLRLDRQVYSSSDEIVLTVTVRNNSLENVFFDVYDPANDKTNDYISYRPVVYDMKGREAELIVPYKQEGKKAEDMLIFLNKRRIDLAPDECHVRKIKLNSIYKLDNDKKYRVRAFLLPDVQAGTAIESDNELSFTVKESRPFALKPDNNSAVRGLTPSEVVLLHLSAEKSKNRDNYLKYLKIEKYIEAFPDFLGKYQRADSYGRDSIEREFIAHITGYRDDYLVDFQVNKQEIADNISYVDAVAVRAGARINFRYRYRYTLERSPGGSGPEWVIINLEATVLKGGMK